MISCQFEIKNNSSKFRTITLLRRVINTLQDTHLVHMEKLKIRISTNGMARVILLQTGLWSHWQRIYTSQLINSFQTVLQSLKP